MMGIVGWLLLGVIAATLERSILPRPGATFLGSLMLAWTGAVLGGLLGYAIGWGGVSDFTVRSVGLAAAGIIVILGGLRLAYHLRGRGV
ncbi:MAG TPA: hypothetical protein VFN22_07745 [Gemmatimonadales bacterium]|nr:hypothetical protein [Gemmatimonadales bacterium]